MNNDKDNIEMDDVDLGESTLVWDGSGKYPSVGSECEFFAHGFNVDYEWGVFHGTLVSGGLIIEHKARDNSSMSYCQPFDPESTTFRPIETPEQKAEREIEEAAIHLWGLVKCAADADWCNASLSVRDKMKKAVEVTGFRAPL